MNIDKTCSEELGPAILKALGLPATATRLVLTFEGGKPTTVLCESLIWTSGEDVAGAASRVSEYALVPIDRPNVGAKRK